MKALRKLVFGETWILPVGIAVLLLGCELVLKPLLGGNWADAGGAIILTFVLALFVLALRDT